MNSTLSYEFGSMSRMVALGGSLVAAIMFGCAFVTDEHLSYAVAVLRADQIALLGLVFVGYLIAWKRGFEIAGSALVFFAAVTYWTWVRSQNDVAPSLWFFIVVVPALFHLLAVTLSMRSGRAAVG